MYLGLLAITVMTAMTLPSHCQEFGLHKLPSRGANTSSIVGSLVGGYCSSYLLGSVATGDTLYFGPLNSYSFPKTAQSGGTYMASMPLDQEIDLTQNINYKLDYITGGTCPGVDGAQFWTDASGEQIISYGGQSTFSSVTIPEIFYEYDVETKACGPYQGTLQNVPARRVGGVSVNVPELQAAYYIGGYQNNLTDSSVNGTFWSTGMFGFNTSTGITTNLSSPYRELNDGSLQYIPVGEQGVLLYIGGQSSKYLNNSVSPNSWDFVQIYDIASDQWFNQSTSGSAPQRLKFCAATAADPASGTYEIYVIGGTDGHDPSTLIYQVSYLSIPSFKWYSANPLIQGRVAVSCYLYGNQLLAIGGRTLNDRSRPCAGYPVLAYNIEAQTTQVTFYPSATTYTAPATVVADMKISPYPSTWADTAVESLFATSLNVAPFSAQSPLTTNVPSATSSVGSMSTNTTTSSNSDTGVIVGGVIAGVFGLVLVFAVIYLVLYQHRRQGDALKAIEHSSSECSSSKATFDEAAELSAGTQPSIPVELSANATASMKHSFFGRRFKDTSFTISLPKDDHPIGEAPE